MAETEGYDNLSAIWWIAPPPIQFPPPIPPPVPPTALQIVLTDGMTFDEKDLAAWAKGDFSSIGLERRELKTIKELAKLLLEEHDQCQAAP